VEPDKYWLLQWTLHGLRHSPRDWYDKINTILHSTGLKPSLEDPCLYSGFVHNPSNLLSAPSLTHITLGLYVDDFDYVLEDPTVEDLFCRILKEKCTVDFMEVVEWFLGIHFS
jgi:hypothetical protein